MPDLTRRKFIQDSTVVAAGLAASAELASCQAAAEPVEFASSWDRWHDRVWLGPEYWSNPLQDWCLTSGRIECLHAALDRNVQLLTCDLGPQAGDLRMS